MNRYIISDLGQNLPDDLLLLKIQAFFSFHPLRTIPNPKLKLYKYASLQLLHEGKFLEFQDYMPAQDRLIAYASERGDFEMITTIIQWFQSQKDYLNNKQTPNDIAIFGYQEAATNDVEDLFINFAESYKGAEIWFPILKSAATYKRIDHIRKYCNADYLTCEGKNPQVLIMHILCVAVKTPQNQELAEYLFTQSQSSVVLHRKVLVHSIISDDPEMIHLTYQKVKNSLPDSEIQQLIDYVKTHVDDPFSGAYGVSKETIQYLENISSPSPRLPNPP